MKSRLIVLLAFLLLLAGHRFILAQDDVTIVVPTSEAGEGLDLTAVSELFKDSKTLEDFEKALNDPETGINNLDLDDNDEVDFIRVMEEAAGDARVIILQVALGKDEFQDVATIEVDRDDEEYNMQVHGNETLFGEDYYVSPTAVHIHTWPAIAWLYRPAYRPYRSVYYFGHYPRWWRPYRPVKVNIYRTRTVRFTRKTTFNVTRTNRVRTVTSVKYKPRSSKLVKKKTVRTTTVKKKGTVRKTGKSTTVKRKTKAKSVKSKPRKKRR